MRGGPKTSLVFFLLSGISQHDRSIALADAVLYYGTYPLAYNAYVACRRANNDALNNVLGLLDLHGTKRPQIRRHPLNLGRVIVVTNRPVVASKQYRSHRSIKTL